MKRFAILLFGLMCAAPVAAEVTGTEVTYHAGDTTLKGFLASVLWCRCFSKKDWPL